MGCYLKYVDASESVIWTPDSSRRGKRTIFWGGKAPVRVAYLRVEDLFHALEPTNLADGNRNADFDPDDYTSEDGVWTKVPAVLAGVPTTEYNKAQWHEDCWTFDAGTMMMKARDVYERLIRDAMAHKHYYSASIAVCISSRVAPSRGWTILRSIQERLSSQFVSKGICPEDFSFAGCAFPHMVCFYQEHASWLKEELAQARKERNENYRMAETASIQSQKIQTMFADVSARYTEALNKIADLSARVNELDASLREERHVSITRRTHNESLNKEVRTLEGMLDEVQNECESYKKKIATLKKQLANGNEK